MHLPFYRIVFRDIICVLYPTAKFGMDTICIKGRYMLFYLWSIASEEHSEKFECLYYQYRNLMMYIALRILKSNELAEEAVQDALVKILINIEDVTDIHCRRTKSWVILITKRTAIDKYNYEKLRKHEPDDSFEQMGLENDTLENTAIQNIQITQVVNAIKLLDEKYSEALILRYYFGYSDSKLAKHFGVSPAAVRKRCERGKKKLLSSLLQHKGVKNESV